MSDRVRKEFTQPSRTKQSFKQDADVNVIMKRFKKVQGQDFLNRYQGYLGGTFGDFSEVVDYRTALEQVKRADEVFMALPAMVRSRFNNRAEDFLDFCQDPVNLEALKELGLAVSPKVENKPENPVISPME